MSRNGKNPAWPDQGSAHRIYAGGLGRSPAELQKVDGDPTFPQKKTHLFLRKPLKMSSILPDEAVFADFRRQCLSADSWVNKYDSNGMQVWVEVPAKKEKRGPKIHKIRVSFY